MAEFRHTFPRPFNVLWLWRHLLRAAVTMQLVRLANSGAGHSPGDQIAILGKWQIPKKGLTPTATTRQTLPCGPPDYLATSHMGSHLGPSLAMISPQNICFLFLPTHQRHRDCHVSPRSNLVSYSSPIFHAASAQKLYSFSNSGPGFFIRGNRINVLHNRRKTSEAQTKPHQTTQHGRPSRAVAISGPGEILDLFSLFNYFEQRFYFHVDRVEPLANDDAAIPAYQIRFASFYCQAEMAVTSVNRDTKFRDVGVQIRYSTDPCESGE